MDCWVIFAYINVHLQSFLRQKLDVEVINSVHEWELTLIVCFYTFSHLWSFCVVVVEVNCNNSYKSSSCFISASKSSNWLETIYIKLCILNFEIKNVFVVSDLWFIGCNWKLANGIFFWSSSIWWLSSRHCKPGKILFKLIHGFSFLICSSCEFLNFCFRWGLYERQTFDFSIVKDSIFSLNVTLQFK